MMGGVAGSPRERLPQTTCPTPSGWLDISSTVLETDGATGGRGPAASSLQPHEEMEGLGGKVRLPPSPEAEATQNFVFQAKT